MIGRWHGSFGAAGAEVLRQDLKAAEGAVARLDEEIAERKKLRREHRKHIGRIKRRLARAEQARQADFKREVA